MQVRLQATNINLQAEGSSFLKLMANIIYLISHGPVLACVQL
jgi:hypothetical protein